MVLNEPKTSLHSDLVRPLAELIRKAAEATQVVVVTHSAAPLDFLGEDATRLELVKDFGKTKLAGGGLLDTPPGDWGKR